MAIGQSIGAEPGDALDRLAMLVEKSLFDPDGFGERGANKILHYREHRIPGSGKLPCEEFSRIFTDQRFASG